LNISQGYITTFGVRLLGMDKKTLVQILCDKHEEFVRNISRAGKKFEIFCRFSSAKKWTHLRSKQCAPPFTMRAGRESERSCRTPPLCQGSISPFEKMMLEAALRSSVQYYKEKQNLFSLPARLWRRHGKSQSLKY